MDQFPSSLIVKSTNSFLICRYNFSSYCLGLLFTNRVFDDLVLGLSWRGNPIPGGVGGICQSLARYKADGKVFGRESL